MWWNENNNFEILVCFNDTETASANLRTESSLNSNFVHYFAVVHPAVDWCSWCCWLLLVSLILRCWDRNSNKANVDHSSKLCDNTTTTTDVTDDAVNGDEDEHINEMAAKPFPTVFQTTHLLSYKTKLIPRSQNDLCKCDMLKLKLIS